MFFFLVFIGWPVAELFVAIAIASAIGVLDTILLLILSLPFGVWAMRSQGRLVYRRFAQALAENRAPGKEVIDGTLVITGGALMVIPGFITDALGLLALFPPTRALIRLFVMRNYRSGVLARAVRFSPAGRDYDVDTTARDVDPPQLRA